jgi:cell filamentation protein, protein adenylyltransferase
VRPASTLQDLASLPLAIITHVGSSNIIHGDPASAAAQFLLRFAQESNQIEDLSIPDADVLASGRRASGQMGALNRALRRAEQRQPVTVADLCDWQAMITREQLRYGHWIDDDHIGCLRRRHMRMGRRRFTAPEDIEPALDELLAELNQGLEREPGETLELGAKVHRRFELIHPFVDGNGRTGRLLTLYQLRAARARPILFTAGDHTSWYFRAFEAADERAMVEYFREHQLPEDPWAQR